MGLYVMLGGPPTASACDLRTRRRIHADVLVRSGVRVSRSRSSTNGYPVKGYDRTRAGLNRIAVLGALAFDCLA